MKKLTPRKGASSPQTTPDRSIDELLPHSLAIAGRSWRFTLAATPSIDTASESAASIVDWNTCTVRIDEETPRRHLPMVTACAIVEILAAESKSAALGRRKAVRHG